jgi:hypothetical protein
MRRLGALTIFASACHLIGGAGDYVIRESEGAGGNPSASSGSGGGTGGTGGTDCIVGVDCPTAWLVTFGNGVEHVVVTDAASSGDVAVVGRFKDPVDFGDGPVATVGDKYDAFVALFDTDGDLRWMHTIGNGVHDQHAEAVAVADDGSVVVVGRFKQTVDFGDGEVASAGERYDVFIVHYDELGALTWKSTFGNGAQDQHVTDVAIDEQGNVVVVGRFRDTVDFGDGPVSSIAGKHDAYVARYDSGGGFSWVNVIGNGAHDQYAEAVAVDSRGNVAVAGRSKETVDFGGGGSDGIGAKYDAFVVKYLAGGSYEWLNRFGNGAEDQHAEALAMDASGNVATAGRFKDPIDFGRGDVAPRGESYDGYVVAHDAAGAFRWVRRFGDGLVDQFPQGLAIHDSGDVIATGRFSGEVDFGGGPTASPAGRYAAFIATYSPLGTFVDASSYGADGGEVAATAVTTALGGVVVAGTFHGTVNFGAGTVASTESATDDAFVLKLRP